MEQLHVSAVHAYREDGSYSENIYYVSDGGAYREIAYFGFPADWHPLKEQQGYDGENE